MPLTRDFKETVQARARRDPAFREGLLKEGVECLLAGDVDAGKIILRDYINATIGFEELSSLTNKPSKSLMRMFGPNRESPRPQPLRRHQPHSAASGRPARSKSHSIGDRSKGASSAEPFAYGHSGLRARIHPFPSTGEGNPHPLPHLHHPQHHLHHPQHHLPTVQLVRLNKGLGRVGRREDLFGQGFLLHV